MNPNEEIEVLKEKLEEQDENCRRAAQIGKTLLEENIDLKSRLDQVVKQYSQKLETLEQENYSYSLKVEGHKKEKIWFDEELSQLKSDLLTQKTNLIDQVENEKQQEYSRFRKQINELKTDYDQSQKIEIQLKDKVQQLEDLLQQQLEQTQVTSRSFSGDEFSDLQQEVIRLQADNTGLTSQMIDAHTECKCVRDECNTLKSKLSLKDDEIQEIQCRMTSYCNSIEKLKTENADLNAQLDALRMEANLQDSKGNSIFSEVEDRRVEAEKRLISLRVKGDAMKEKLEMERQLHQKLKMQMVMLLQMSTGQSDQSSSITRLQSQLTEARTTIQELMDKIENMEKNGNVYNKLSEIENNVTEEDKEYVQYLITMLKSKETEVTNTNQQLRHKNLQYLDVSNKVLSQDRTIMELQQKYDSLRGSNMKLTLKLEELQLKYEPDKLNDRKDVLQKKKEKIPLEQVDNNMEKEITEKINPNLRISNVSMASRDNIPTDIKLINKVKLSCKKSVSMSDDVQVITASGDVENQFLSDNVTDISKIEVKARKRPAKESKVKQVKMEAVDINECKNQ